MISIKLNNWQLEHIHEGVTYILSQDDVEKIGNDCSYEYINWAIVVSETQAYQDYLDKIANDELKTKMNRLYDIDTELKKLNAPWITLTKPSLIVLNDAKVIALNAEAETIQSDISDNYDTTLVDDLYTSLFL